MIKNQKISTMICSAIIATTFVSCSSTDSSSLNDVSSKETDFSNIVTEAENSIADTSTATTTTAVFNIDPFDYFTINFDGIAPYASATHTGVVQDYDGIFWFASDNTTNLKNGDVIKVEACTDNNKIRFIRTSQEFIVEGLPEYTYSLDNITDECWDNMLSQAEDAIMSTSASWNDTDKILEMEHIGDYYLKLKEGFSDNKINDLVCVYKIRASVTGSTLESREKVIQGEETYYIYYEYSNLITESDGSCSVDLSSGFLPTDTIKSKYGSWFGMLGVDIYYGTYQGFDSIDSIYRKCVLPNLEKYTCESTVDE